MLNGNRLAYVRGGRQPGLSTRLSLESLEERRLLAANTGCEVPIETEAGPAAIASAASAQGSSVQAIGEFMSLTFPDGTPTSFTTTVQFEGQTLTLQLEKNHVFGENTQFLIDNGSGHLVEIDPGIDRSYLGSIAERPEFGVSAVLTDGGLFANIIRPGQISITVEPVSGAGEAGLHKVFVGEGTDAHDHESGGIGEEPADATSVTVGPIQIDSTPLAASAASDSETIPTSAAATLPPSRVIDVLEFEVGVEIASDAFLNNYSGSTIEQKMASAMAEAQKIPGNLDARFLHATGIKYRLGTVIMRTIAGSDPFNVANGNDTAGLSAFRNYWNNLQANEGIAPTHDLAVYHVRASPSGLAYSQNTVGTSNRYALTASNGPSSWADGTLAHEFGHSWTLPHTGDGMNQGLFYEQRPRNNNGSSTAGGNNFFISPMNGSGDHNIGRFATDEANRIFNLREGKRQFAEVVANPGPIKPFGHRDSAVSAGGPIVIDVIANDYDVNNDVLDVQLLDTVSFLGGTIALSVGTGPGGRDEIIYTPPASGQGDDFFSYTVADSTGRSDFGTVNVLVNPPVETAYQFDFGIDENPAYSGTNAPAGLSVGNEAWNLVTKSNADLVNVLDSEGQASSINLKLREAGDGTAFDFAAPAAGLEGRDANYSDFYGTDLLSNLMFTRNSEDLGIQIEGLPSGAYTAYAILREPIAPDRTYSIDIGTGTIDTPSFGDFGGGNQTTTDGAPSQWSRGQNYYTETVDVYDGDSLFVLIDSLDSDFVSLQGLQLTKIGEVDPAPANAYQIDFGPTDDGVQSGAIGPAGLPGSFATWNGYDRTNEELASVLDAQGNSAAGVDVRVREASDGRSFDFDAPVDDLENRDGNFSGFYSPDLLSSLMFSRDNDDLGVRVEGLAPGEYQVYAIAREPDSGAGTGSQRTYSFDIGASSSASVKFGDLGLGHVTATPSSAPDTWVENQNYYAETVTVAAGQSLYVLMDSTNSAFGLLQGLQIVQRSITPELIGDYNQDGTVDAADYTVWRDQKGTTVEPSTGADGTGDGIVDADDYSAWSGAYGQSLAPQDPAEATMTNQRSLSESAHAGVSDNAPPRLVAPYLTTRLSAPSVRSRLPLPSRAAFSDPAAIDQALLLLSIHSDETKQTNSNELQSIPKRTESAAPLDESTEVALRSPQVAVRFPGE